MAATTGAGFTVTLVVTVVVHEKPFVTVYETTALPAETPVTVPEVPTVATAKSELDHTPPAVALLRLVVRF
jgi:hypothetical protein